MKRKFCITAAGVLGFMLGFALGPTIFLILALSDYLFRGWNWQDFSDIPWHEQVLISGIVAINCSLGAMLVAWKNYRRRLPITILPAIILLLFCAVGIIDRYTRFLNYFSIGLTLAVVILTAGRLGQYIGRLFYREKIILKTECNNSEDNNLVLVSEE
ncbi:MAG: hypothetical protein R3B84_02730 [Zavarzinella sp.]